MLHKLLGWFNGRKPHGTGNRRAKLCLETLENRDLMATGLVNQPPLLAVSSESVSSYGAAPITIPLGAHDADGDRLVFQAGSPGAAAFALDQRLNLSRRPQAPGGSRALHARWMNGANGIYSILPNGEVRQWLGNVRRTRQPRAVVAVLDPSYFARPQLLFNAKAPAPLPAAVTMNGDQLTITPPSGFAGTFSVEVWAGDARAVAARHVAVTVSPRFTLDLGDPLPVAEKQALPSVMFEPVTNRVDPGLINGFDETVIGDFDGDRRDDIFFREIASGENRILFSRGNEDFSPVINRIGPGAINGYDQVVAGDFNGDGKDDLFGRVNHSGANRFILAAPGHDEQFYVAGFEIGWGAVNGYDRMVAGDFNGDRLDDLFFLARGSGANRVAFNRGGGVFTIQEPFGWGSVNGYDEMAAGDFDGDGRDDIMFRVIESGANRIAFARGVESFTIVTDRIAPGYINGFDEMSIGDVNSDGRDDMLFREVESGVNRLMMAKNNSNEEFYRATNSLQPGWLNGYDRAIIGNFNGYPGGEIFLREVESGDNRIAFPRNTPAKFVEDNNTTQYVLSHDGRLSTSDTTDNGVVIATGVADFAVNERELTIYYRDGRCEVTLLAGDLAEFMARAKAQDTAQGGAESTYSSGLRGVVGKTTIAGWLGGQGDAQAPKSMLASVGRVLIASAIPGQFQFRGSGTVLAWGGNRYVLTAAHVVKGSTPAQIRFDLDGSAFPTQSGGLVVDRVWGSESFGGRDLALLRLAKALPDSIVGAQLPDAMPVAVGSQVLVIGYGRNNHDAVGGVMSFGYARLDGVNQSYTNQTGPFIVNQYANGEAAFDHGDSGGPDFVAQRAFDRNGHAYWTPLLVGVHSFFLDQPLAGTNAGNDRIDIGENTYSLQIDAQLSRTIKGIIPPPAKFADIWIQVTDDGDPYIPLLNQTGEWHVDLTINGDPQHLERDFGDGSIAGLSRVNVSNRSQLSISFGGYEEDTGWLDGNDTIPAFSRTLDVPDRIVALGRTPLGSYQDGAGYTMWVEFGYHWAD